MKNTKCDPLSNSCYFCRFWKAKGGVPCLILRSKFDQKSTKNHENTPSKKHQKNDAEKREKKQKTRQSGRPDTMKSLIQPK